MTDPREALVALILERFRAAETYMDLPRQAGLLADAILALPPGRTETEVKAEAWDEAVDTLSRHWEDFAPAAVADLERRNPYRKEANDE